MSKPDRSETAAPAVGSPLDCGVGRLEPELEDFDYDDLLECPRCHGDGMDPWVDYLLPCPRCQGEQTP
jgi:hypothetical protein